ncbi:MAG: response regulator [Clostridia bacterium]
MIKVLIVEDEEIIRNGLRYTVDWLKMDCAVVGACEDGEEGLLAIEKLKPDVVITDIKMPIMDGLEMLEKAIDKGYNFQSIVLTSYSEFEYAVKSIKLKVFDYITKPISDERLTTVMANIKEVLQKERENQIACEVVEDIKGGFDVAKIFEGNFENPYVKKTLDEIKENYASKISIESIANELEVSASYLSRMFKKETNETFLDLLNKYRIQKAVEKLKTGKKKVYEVSEEVGFSEYKRFYAVFKTYIGVSPTDFVKKSFTIIE